MTGCTGCRSEFRLRNFGFGGVSDREFALPQAKWRCQPFIWILYRIALAIYFIVWLVLIIIYWGEPPLYIQADTKAKWPIFVSNWNYFFVCLYFLMSAISTVVYHMKTQCKVSSADINDSDTKPEAITLSTINGRAKETPRGYDNKGHQTDGFKNSNYDHESQNNGRGKTEPATPPTLAWYFKLTWFLQNICFSGSLFVTLLFWALDFDYETGTIHVFNLHVHGINLIFVIIDQFLIASPFRLLHVIYPSIFAWVYFVFNLIYYAAGGLNEKPIDLVNGNTALYQGTVDWLNEPVTSVIVMVLTVFVATPVLHLLFWGMYQLRRCCNRRGCCECC